MSLMKWTESENDVGDEFAEVEEFENDVDNQETYEFAEKEYGFSFDQTIPEREVTL